MLKYVLKEAFLSSQGVISINCILIKDLLTTQNVMALYKIVIITISFSLYDCHVGTI